MSDPVIESLIFRVSALEIRERYLTEALLDYIRADLAAPWVPAAKRLEALLMSKAKV